MLKRVIIVGLVLGAFCVLLNVWQSSLHFLENRSWLQKKQVSAYSGVTLHISVWENYFDPWIADEFRKATGIALDISIHASNEDLLDKMDKGKEYDLVMPSDYMVEIMRRRGFLSVLDHDKIPNYANLDPRFRYLSYDSGNLLSIPFLWGTAGICYASGATEGIPLSWQPVFDPGEHSYLQGRVTMLNEMRVTLGTALLVLGLSPNTVRPDEIQKAADLLKAQRGYLLGYESDRVDKNMLDGRTLVAQCWSGAASRANLSNRQIRYSLPEEGVVFFIDNLAIPVTSKHQAEAMLFINFLLDPEISAHVTNFSNYANSNRASRKFVDRRILKGAPYLDPLQMPNSHLLEDVGDATLLYEKAWAEVLATPSDPHAAPSVPSQQIPLGPPHTQASR